MDTLFYDGSCPLCAREIKHLNQMKDHSLRLLDIHSIPADRLPASTTKIQLLSRLHLITANGEWLTGLDATVAAWRHTNIGWLLVPIRWPIVKQLSDWCYDRWASSRTCKLD